MPEHVSSLAAEHFDPRSYDLYWRFLAERQAIWLRRSRGMEAPWTLDSVLQTEFITNVYRQLDPGTEYVIDSILSYPEASDEAKVFNIMLYRLMGSVPSTHQHIGFVHPNMFSQDSFDASLRGLPDDYRIFGDAYRVASYADEGSDKVEAIGNMFAYLAGGMDETVRRIKASRRVVEVYKVFEAMKGFGEFLSHQIIVDLLYADRDGNKIIPFNDDEFAKAGPGARKGLWTLVKQGIKPANLTIVLEWLRDNQQEEFARRDILFPYLAGDDSEPKLMSICDIQASLCEFYKYYRLWSGEKAGAVRKYQPRGNTPYPYPVHLTDDETALLMNLDPPYTFVYDGETASELLSGEDDEEVEQEITEDAAPLPLDQGVINGVRNEVRGQRLDFEVDPLHPVVINISINLNFPRGASGVSG